MFYDSGASMAGEGGNRRAGPALDGRNIAAELTDQEVIFGLARRLYQEKDFLRAAEQYMLFYRLFPHSKQAEEALFRAGLSYMGAMRWQEAASRFEELENESPDSLLAPQALYLQGQCLRSMGRVEDARTVWSGAAERYPNSIWGQRAAVDNALSKGEERDYSGAQRGLMDIGSESRFYNAARLMAGELEGMDQLPRKSPAAAGILSAVLPGSGQFYLGRYRHGTVAVILNGLTIWGAAEAFENGDEGLGAALLILEAIWYSATVVGALNAAYKMNRQVEQDYFLELERRHFFPRHDEPPGPGAGLELRFSF